MIYELRRYQAVPGKLGLLSERFKNHTMRIFRRHGIKSIGYWMDAENSTSNCLTYIIAFESEDQRAACWASFKEDSEWKALREEGEKDGPLVQKVDATVLRPTDYSPLQ